MDDGKCLFFPKKNSLEAVLGGIAYQITDAFGVIKETENDFFKRGFFFAYTGFTIK